MADDNNVLVRELERAERELFDARASRLSSTFHGRERTQAALREVERLRGELAALRTPAPAPVGGDVVGLQALVHESLFHLRLDAGAKAYHDKALTALQSPPAPEQDAVERAAFIIAQKLTPPQSGEILRMPKHGMDTLSGRDGSISYTWDFAEKCRDIARAALAAMPPKVPFQHRVGDWMKQCFTPEIVAGKLERSDRFIEEALELVQACGYDAARAHALVDYVFSRPVGEPSQEVGGVMVTLAALCNPHGLDMEQAAETELARILQPVVIEKIRAKQASKPTGSALPIPVAKVEAPAADEVRELVEAAYREGHQRGRIDGSYLEEDHDWSNSDAIAMLQRLSHPTADAVTVERERCAKIADRFAVRHIPGDHSYGRMVAAEDIAAASRSGGAHGSS
ncbi:hypothetical protein [Caenibius sp. WL]|uniref:hypothetical protein n=1 Tax=Caenibius sp. WL TaxID=2872646 RepID=UPI001C993559|nr:hypothetical protein [Caenibius sp. WL]QZP07805.1 hypothetical protein K5X80_14300 [Caenibius sp. WL]QZP09963.1 hypothetical protein K5X80_16905 [Caenibius sp. WL]